MRADNARSGQTLVMALLICTIELGKFSDVLNLRRALTGEEPVAPARALVTPAENAATVVI